MLETKDGATRIDRATLALLAATLYGKPGAPTIPAAFMLAAEFIRTGFVETPELSIVADGDVFTIRRPKS